MSSKQNPRLKIIQENGYQSEFEINADVVRIGRSNQAEIIINDKAASRLHAEISNLDGECYLKDLDSRNGTQLNGEGVREERLKHNDTFQIGKMQFVFIDPNAPAGADGDLFDDMSDEDWENLGSKKAKKQPSKKEDSLYNPLNLIMLLSAVGVVAFAVVMYFTFIQPPPAKQPETVKLPKNLNQAWGFLVQGDRTRADKVVFEFDVEEVKKMELNYKVFGNDKEDEIVIFLNGQVIGKPKRTGPGEWGLKETVTLFPEMLKQGQNILVFENMRVPPNAYDFYGVSAVEVVEAERFVCDEAKGEEAFLLGKESYNSKNVAKRNLYLAYMKLSLALDSTKTCKPKPAFYPELTTLYKKVQEEHESEMAQLFSTANTAIRTRDFDGAFRFLNEILERVPDPEAEEYQKAQREIRQLERQIAGQSK